MSSTVAVLIPAYNSRDTIAATLDSVQQQLPGCGNVAGVYVADDCSTDDTCAVAQKAWHSYVPLHVLSSPQNFGERANVNKALSQLKPGVDWLLLLHADDVAKDRWFATLLSRIEVSREDIASICSSYDILMPDSSVLPGEDNDRETEVIEGIAGSVRGTLLRGCWWHISGCAIRIRAFQDVGGFDPTLPQMGDWEWALRCLHRGWAIEYVPKTLLFYRQHPSSVSSKSFQVHRDISESLRIVQQYGEVLSAKDLSVFHFGRGWWGCRRIVSSLRLGNVPRAARAGAMIGRTFVNLLQCIRSSTIVRLGNV